MLSKIFNENVKKFISRYGKVSSASRNLERFCAFVGKNVKPSKEIKQIVGRSGRAHSNKIEIANVFGDYFQVAYGLDLSLDLSNPGLTF